MFGEKYTFQNRKSTSTSRNHSIAAYLGHIVRQHGHSIQSFSSTILRTCCGPFSLTRTDQSPVKSIERINWFVIPMHLSLMSF